VGPRAGLDRCEKYRLPPGFDLRTAQLVAQSLYRLSYPAHMINIPVQNTRSHSQALQPTQGLGRLKKSPPTISVLGLASPIIDSRPLSIPYHSIHPSIHLRFGLSTRLQPSGLSKVIFLHGILSCIRTIHVCPAHLSLVILIVVTKSVSSYRRYSSSFYLDLHIASSQIGS
jgi:hypothetical protein